MPAKHDDFKLWYLCQGRILILTHRFRWTYTQYTHIYLYTKPKTVHKRSWHITQIITVLWLFFHFSIYVQRHWLTIKVICILLIQIHEKLKKNVFNWPTYYLMYNISSVNFWQQQLHSICVSLYSLLAPQNIWIFALELSYTLIAAFKCFTVRTSVIWNSWSGTFCGYAQFNKNHTKINNKLGWSHALY